MSDITTYHEKLEEKVIEKVFHEASAEFWLQLDDGLSERFGEMVRDYVSLQDVDQLKFILKDFKRWKEDHINEGGKP